MSDLLDDLSEYWKQKDRDEVEYHLHPEGQTGGSDVAGCPHFRAWKKAGRKTPRKTGLKGNKGAMMVGKYWHKKIQKIWEKKYLSPKWLCNHPDEIYGKEVYVEVELCEGLKELSPIDVAFVTRPGYVERTVKFKNVEKKVLMKHPMAKWVRIIDIKTSDNYGFYLHKRVGLGMKYDGQGHGYMAATGLNTIDFTFFRKGNLEKFYITVHFDPAFWERVKGMNARMLELKEKYENNEEVQNERFDFIAFLDPEEDVECRYCALSQTHEVEIREGEFRLILDYPCEPVTAMLIDDAKEKFYLNSWWKRGRSQAVVTQCSEETLTVTNKSGKEFVDSYYYALTHYKPREGGPPPPTPARRPKPPPRRKIKLPPILITDDDLEGLSGGEI